VTTLIIIAVARLAYSPRAASTTTASPGLRTAAAAAPSVPSVPSALPPTATPTPTTSSPTSSPATKQQSKSGAARRLADLIAQYSASATSVAVTDVATGATVTAGASSGMVTASVVKLQLLETLLLQHQRAGTTLTDDEVATVTSMIENSSNDAAEATFWDVGGRDAVVDYEHRLGLSTAKTVPGSDDYWGLTDTSASQQLVLLQNLVAANSPLDKANRTFALSLLRDVEADQRWGVPVVADTGSAAAVKNGWLSVTEDSDLWTVNSDGIVTVDGRLVLISVMTQHNQSMSDGVARVEQLSRVAVRALTAIRRQGDRAGPAG
jgi:hypothetical protein